MKKTPQFFALMSPGIVFSLLLCQDLNAEPVAAHIITPGADSDHYTVTRYLDKELLKRHQNFGYTEDEIRKYFDYPQIFEYDTSGMTKSLIKPNPGWNARFSL